MLNAFYSGYMKKKENVKDATSFYEIKAQAKPIKKLNIIMLFLLIVLFCLGMKLSDL